jgi:hypothetical protein
MSGVRLEVDSTCPACKSDSRLPPDGESEDVFFCAYCLTKLVIKVAPFDAPMRAWVVTYESEQAETGRQS